MENISNSQLSTTKLLQDDNVKFSILTPCFNSAGTIAKTIESVIGQTYLNWEHIIIDGGSTDGTIDIIRKNEARYEGRLKFISEPDNGPNEAIRKGLLMVDGELVGFLGSDDWYEIDALDVVNKIHFIKNIIGTTITWIIQYKTIQPILSENRSLTPGMLKFLPSKNY